MIGSPAIAAWIAQMAFWVLLTLGVFYAELGRRSAAVFLALWALGYFGLPSVIISPYIALLDIALVWLVFKGDVRLTG